MLVPEARGRETSDCYLASKLRPQAESLSQSDEEGSPLSQRMAHGKRHPHRVSHLGIPHSGRSGASPHRRPSQGKGSVTRHPAAQSKAQP